MKKYVYKVYNKANGYLNTWTDVINEFNYNQEINTAGSQLIVKLPRNAGDYGEGTDIDFGFRVKVTVYDTELPNGKQVFQGYISSYEPNYTDNCVDVTVLSDGADFDTFMLQDNINLATSLVFPTSNNNITGLFYPAYYPYAIVGLPNSGAQEIRAGVGFTPAAGLTSIGAFDVTMMPWYYPSTGNTALETDTFLSLYLDNGSGDIAPGTNPIATATLTAGTQKYGNTPYLAIKDYGAGAPIYYRFNFNTAVPVTPGVKYIAVVYAPTLTYVDGGKGTPAGGLWFSWAYGSNVENPSWTNCYAGALATGSYTGYYTVAINEYSAADSGVYTGACFPFQALSADGTTTVSFNSQDPGAIMRGIIDRYRSQNGVINYDSSTIELTGTTVSYTFNANTVLEAIKKVLELSPSGWYWYVDYSTNMLHFHQEGVTPEHTFGLEKDILKLKIRKTIENLINTIYFTGGDMGGGLGVLYKKYVNTDSLNSYGIKASKYIDQRVTNTTTAQTIANAILEKKSQPELRVDLEIVDSNGTPGLGYDIETVQVGDIVSIRNINQTVGLSTWDFARFDQDYWDFNIYNLSSLQLQIQKINYTADTIQISASTLAPDVNKRIEDINRSLEATQTLGLGSAPS